MDFCDANHLAGVTSVFRPTRLLDLRVEESSENFRLITPSDSHTGHDMRYAALSYCWGPQEDAKKQLKTLSCNVQQNHDCILFNSVTPVIQDAITAARAISVRYLWIDALCIIQDNARDWAHESDQMGSVYANAYVTLCSLWSASCMEGFLDRPSMISVKIQSQQRPGAEDMFTLRHEPHKHVGYNVNHDIASENLWARRAWTMQKKYLSKRRLYLDRLQMYLDCSRGRVTETSDHVMANEVTKSFTDNLLLLKENRNDEILYNKWNSLFVGYLSRLLSHQMDTLPAIAGLARIMAAELDDTCLVGLWKHDLPRGLLWHPTRPIEDWANYRRCFASHCGAEDYIAPTWSWARQGVEKDYQWNPFTVATRPMTDYDDKI